MKRKLSVLGLLLLGLLVFLIPLTKVAASSTVGDASQFMTKVSLSEDSAGEKAWQSGDSVSVKTPFYIRYDWSVPKATPGETYEMTLPNQIMLNGTSIPMRDADGTVIATTDVKGDKVKITFNDGVSNKKDIKGYFSIGASFDKQTGEDGQETELNFPVAGSVDGGQVKLNVENKKNDSGPSSGQSIINKSGLQVKDKDGKLTDLIEWTITVNKRGTKLTNPTVEETFGEGQTFVKDSISVNYRNGSDKSIKKLNQDEVNPVFSDTDLVHGGGSILFNLLSLENRDDAGKNDPVSPVIRFRTQIMNFDKYYVGDIDLPKLTNPKLVLKSLDLKENKEARPTSVNAKTSQYREGGLPKVELQIRRNQVNR